MTNAEPFEVFYSYSHDDEEYRKELEKALTMLRRQGLITNWNFHEIVPGQEGDPIIKQHLERARIILLLVSSDFLFSEYCYETELRRAIERHDRNDAVVIPIFVRACDFSGAAFEKLQSLPSERKAISSWDNADEAYTDVAKGIRRAVIALRDRLGITAPPTATTGGPAAVAQSAIWNINQPRNPNFTGRVDLLKRLRETLTSGKHAALSAIHGMGGVGKTQLALEYAYEHSKDYKLVWWVRAEESTTLAADLAALAAPLRLPEAGLAEQPVIVAAVLKWLSENARWLLILDNVPHPDTVKGVVPVNPQGHLIITSRDPNWGHVAKKLEVTTMAPGDAAEFLCGRTGDTDRSAAADLAEELGYLPLALEQAGAYVEQSAIPIRDFLRLLTSRPTEAFKHAKAPEGYPHTVGTVWEMSVRAVERESEAAAQLLNLCAFLAPDDIPKSIVTASEKHLFEPLASAVNDELVFSDTVAVLRRYSLVTASVDALSIHRLLQQALRQRLPESFQSLWGIAGLRIISATFPFGGDDVRTWDICTRLWPHAQAVLARQESLDTAPEQRGQLLNKCGLYAWGRANSQVARELFEQALTIAERVYGSDHPKVAVALNNLGLVLKDLGEFVGAKGNFERAITIDEKVYGSHHLELAPDVNNLGSVLLELGDLTGSRRNFERALAIAESVLGPDHPKVAICLNNLGNAMQALGDRKVAKHNYERAKTIDEKAYGPDHPMVATDLNNLGSVLKELGDLGGAKRNIELAHSMLLRALGEAHPSTVIVRKNLESLVKEEPTKQRKRTKP